MSVWLPLLWIVAASASILLWKPLGITHDAGFYVECGRRIAEGAWPYRDFFDINPPLIMYLNAVPALAARILSVHPIPAFTFALILLSAWSAWRAQAIAARAGAPDLLDRATLVLPALVIASAYPDAGQREHLFFLLYYPFLVLRAVRWSGGPAPPRAWAYGVAAAAGVALKPSFAIAALVPELAMALGRRRWRPLRAPEAVAAVATCVAYVLHLALLPADVRDTFFGRILPTVFGGYAAYDNPLSLVLMRAGRRAAVAIVVLGIIWRLPKGDAVRPLVRPAAFFTCGALLSAVLQHKGWSYHFQPADQTLLLLMAIAGSGVVRAAARRLNRPQLTGAAAGVAIVGVLAAPAAYAAQLPARSEWAPLIERVSAPGDPVLILSTSVTYAHPAILQAGRRFGSRHQSALLLALTLEAARTGLPQADRFETRMVEELKEDVRRWRPAAVLIDRQPGCHGCPPGFTLLDYLRRRGLLDAMTGAYRYSGEAGGLAIYVRNQ